MKNKILVIYSALILFGVFGILTVIHAELLSNPFGTSNFESYNEKGFFYQLADHLQHMADLGLRFQRLSTTQNAPTWETVQPVLGGPFVFGELDRTYSAFTQRGIEIMVTFKSDHNQDQRSGCNGEWMELDGDNAREPHAPCDMEAYRRYLRATVERYDGDGDYGCDALIQAKNPRDCYDSGDQQAPVWSESERPIVRYWQLSNELSGLDHWGDTPQSYAELAKVSHQIIHEACPNCQFLFGGQSGGGQGPAPTSLQPFYEELLVKFSDLYLFDGVRYFDVIDFHNYRSEGGYSAGLAILELFRSKLATLSIGKLPTPFWVTETGTWTDDPSGICLVPNPLPTQTERRQAAELARRYVSLFAAGVRRVNWHKIVEPIISQPGCPCQVFEFMGLIHNPLNQDVCGDIKTEGNPAVKLSYFTYRELVRRFNGLLADGVEARPQPGDGVRLYRARIASGADIGVVWREPFGVIPVEVRLNEPWLDAGRAAVIAAIPSGDSGKEIQGTPVFNKIQSRTDGSSLLFSLGSEPVYILQDIMPPSPPTGLTVN